MSDDPDIPPTWGQTASRAVSEQLREMPVIGQAVGHALAVVIEDAQARRTARVNATLTAIGNRVGDVDQIGRRLADNQEVEAVFVRGVNAAVNTGLEAKRRLLAQVISAAILDDARVDESALIVQALRDLDAPHFRALERIRREQDTPQDRSGPPPPGGWPSSDQHVVDLVNAESVPVVAALLRAGALKQVTGELVFGVGGPLVVTGLSDFGRDLLDDVRAHDVNHQL